MSRKDQENGLGNDAELEMKVVLPPELKRLLLEYATIFHTDVETLVKKMFKAGFIMLDAEIKQDGKILFEEDGVQRHLLMFPDFQGPSTDSDQEQTKV